MSAKSPWNTHAVIGIFYPRPFFAATITIVSPLPPLHNVKSIAEALSSLERYHSPSSAICITSTQHCFTGEGILLFVYSINQRKCSKTFGRHCRETSTTKATHNIWRTKHPAERSYLDANELATVRRDIEKKQRLSSDFGNIPQLWMTHQAAVDCEHKLHLWISI